MSISRNFVAGLAMMAAFCGTALAANAQEITRLSDNPNSPFAEAVAVPLPGYTLYFISGTPGAPSAGGTAGQMTSSLDKLDGTLKKLGAGDADVVQAHVFLAGDPAKGGKPDLAARNSEWAKKFGTTEQPDKPSRTTVWIDGLASPGGLVEIDYIAAKKN